MVVFGYMETPDQALYGSGTIETSVYDCRRTTVGIPIVEYIQQPCIPASSSERGSRLSADVAFSCLLSLVYKNAQECNLRVNVYAPEGEGSYTMEGYGHHILLIKNQAYLALCAQR